MVILVVGATGATGRWLVRHLLQRGVTVRVVVRAVESLPDDIRNHPGLCVTQAALLDLSDEQLREQVRGCDAVASCLGHTLSFRGIYGQPRRLVTEAVRRLTQAIADHKPDKAVKFVLMNTTGNRNADLAEPISLAQSCVLGLVRLLVPPHVDNEQAAEYLRTEIGQDRHTVEWVVVRPDSLIDEDAVSAYELHPSPIRSTIFDAGVTSRINVGCFMAELMTDELLWEQWKGQMPVIYNRETDD